jgi:hypothetical protein
MFKQAIRLKPVSAFLDFWHATMGHDFDPDATALRMRTWQQIYNGTDPDEVLLLIKDLDASKGFRALLYPIRLRRLYRLLHKRVRQRRFVRVRNHIRRRMIWALERLPWTSVPTGGTNADSTTAVASAS